MPTASRPVQKWASPQHPLLHRGEVTFTGSTTVDLGIGHNNYKVALSLVGGLAAQNIAPHISWARTSRPGVFQITAGKYTAAGDTTIIAATAACTVSFTVTVDASVSI